MPGATPASVLIMRRFRLSSPGLSMGVSQMNGIARNFGWQTIRRKPSLPISPFADMLVPVDVRAKTRLRVIGVNHTHVP